MRTGVIVQARMSSTRLPGKVVADICGKTTIQRVLERLQPLIPSVDYIVAAIPHEDQDSLLYSEANEFSDYVFVGDRDDVLRRYHQCAKFMDLDIIIRITADCPLIDHKISGQVLDLFLRGDCDYASNVHPATFPDGLDTEVFTVGALEKAHREAKTAYDAEHVTPYIYHNPDKFRIANLFNYEDLSFHRWTLDTPSDLEFIRDVYSRVSDMALMPEILNTGLLNFATRKET